MKIKHVQELVEESLISDPNTRNSDKVLYISVVNKINPAILRMPMETVLLNEKNLNIPSIESVGRARRKIQEYNPLLRANKAVDNARYEQWKEYREYALSEV